jgi:mevalonate kinase
MPIGYGKVILLGEHSVVYGRPALGAAIGVGCRVEASPAHRDHMAVELAGARSKAAISVGFGGPPPEPLAFELTLERPASHPEHEKMRLGLRALLESYGQRPNALRIDLRMEVPGGAGLGCSAACGVAIVRALDEVYGIKRDAAAVAQASMPWERIFHGNPSGMDSAIAASGAVAIFRKGRPLQLISAGGPLELVIGHSGVVSSTITTVTAVADLHAKYPSQTEALFDEIAGLVDSAAAAVRSGELGALGRLMSRNHQLLSSLKVSTPGLDEMCAAAITAGALGAKLTGKGGGGCMIALAPDHPTAERIAAQLQQLNRETMIVGGASTP